jgi:hypothetical protein
MVYRECRSALRWVLPECSVFQAFPRESCSGLPRENWAFAVYPEWSSVCQERSWENPVSFWVSQAWSSECPVWSWEKRERSLGWKESALAPQEH